MSQYAAGDPVKFLTNYNSDMATIDAALKEIHVSDQGKVPTGRRIATLPLSSDITAAQLQAAGLAAGDASGNAQNALKLGGVLAANFPQVSSGTWTPGLAGYTTAGSPTYTKQMGTYYKIGTFVIVGGTVEISAKGGMSGNIKLTGLPFVTGDPYFSGQIVSASGMSLGSEFYVVGLTAWGGANFTLLSYGNATLIYNMTDDAITDNFMAVFEAFYNAVS